MNILSARVSVQRHRFPLLVVDGEVGDGGDSILLIDRAFAVGSVHDEDGDVVEGLRKSRNLRFCLFATASPVGVNVDDVDFA